MIIGLAAAVVAIATAAPQSACELHLFAMDLSAGPQPMGNLLVRPLPRNVDPLALNNIMNPRDRMADVSDAQYRQALGISANASIVPHWGLRIDPSVKKVRAPLVQTHNQCHAELVGYYSMALQANRSSSHKDEVLISFAYRGFGADGQLIFDIKKDGYGAVETAQKVGRDQALASLKAASLAIIQDFAKRSARQRALSGLNDNEVKQ